MADDFENNFYNNSNNNDSFNKGREGAFGHLKGKFGAAMGSAGKIIGFTAWKWYYMITVPCVYVAYKLLQNEAFQNMVNWFHVNFLKGIEAANNVVAHCIVNDMGGLLNFLECVGRQ